MPRTAPAFCLAVLFALGPGAPPGTPFAPKIAFAASESGKKQIAVGKVQGPNATKVRVALMKRIKDSGWYNVADAEDLKPTLPKSKIAKLAGILGANGIVMGTVSKKMDLTLVIYKASGEPVAEVLVKGGSLKQLEATLESDFDTTIAGPLADATGGYRPGPTKPPSPPEMEEEPEPDLDALGGGAAEPESEEEDEEPTDEAVATEPEEAADEPAPEKAKKKAGRTPFELVLGLRGYNREFNYTDPVGQRDTTPPDAGGPRPRNLVPYKLAFAPALKASTRLYPLAFFRDDAAGWFGVAADFELGIATTTNLEEQLTGGQTRVTKLKTSAQAFDVGLRARLPIGPVELGIFGMYGSQSFVLVGDEGGTGLEPLVPDVRYNYVRVGGDIRARISKLLIGAHIAPRFLLSLHQIDLEYVWFPGAKGKGLDFGLDLGWQLLPWLDVVAGANVVRYGFDFNGIPAEAAPCPDHLCRSPVIAGGATDTYISGWLGVMVTLGGSK